MKDTDMDIEKIVSSTSIWLGESAVSALTQEDLTCMIQAGERHEYKKNEVVIPGESYIRDFYFIESGLIKCVAFNQKGNTKTVSYSDRFLNLEGFFHGNPSAYYSVAALPSVVYRIPRDVFMKEILCRDTVRDSLLMALSHKCRLLGFQVTDLSLMSQLERVCRLLCCYHFPVNQFSNIKLTHQDISEITGLHRVTVTKTLLTIENMGLIERNGDKIIIKDIRGLEELGFSGTIDG